MGFLDVDDFLSQFDVTSVRGVSFAPVANGTHLPRYPILAMMKVYGSWCSYGNSTVNQLPSPFCGACAVRDLSKSKPPMIAMRRRDDNETIGTGGTAFMSHFIVQNRDATE